jgi:hypothetical protein
MLVTVNGTRLWFDVDGPAVEPDGAKMRERPLVEGAGHLPWKDAPDRHWPLVTGFVTATGARPPGADGECL